MLRDPDCADLFHQVILQSLPAAVQPHSLEQATSIGRLFVSLLADDPMTASTAQLLVAQREVAQRVAVPGDITPPFQLVDDPASRRRPRDVPMLIGTARDELRAFFPDASARQTDDLFARGSLELAATMTTAYAYRFDWSAPRNALGACHCIELPFVFGGLDAWHAAPMLAGADPADLARLVGLVQRAWILFIHRGTPGWRQYDADEPASVHHFV